MLTLPFRSRPLRAPNPYKVVLSPHDIPTMPLSNRNLVLMHDHNTGVGPLIVPDPNGTVRGNSAHLVAVDLYDVIRLDHSQVRAQNAHEIGSWWNYHCINSSFSGSVTISSRRPFTAQPPRSGRP